MKKPTIEDLQKELEAANKRIEILNRQLHEAEMVEDLIVAARLLDKDKFAQARDLINPDS